MRFLAFTLRSWRNGRLAVAVLIVLPLVHAQTDGARKWAFSTGASALPGNILSSPAIGLDGTVYIGTEIGASTSASPSGQLFAISPSGTQKWAFTAPDWIDSTPVVAPDGTIYFGCWDGNLYALNPDGTLKWKFGLGAFASASPALGTDGTIYIGAGDGSFYAVNPNGTQKWVFLTLYWIDSAPAIAPDGTIYLGSEDNTFYAINPDGTAKWSYTTGNDIVSSPAIAADGTIYFGSRDLNLYAFTPAGQLKWKFGTTDMVDASPVLGADGTVYFATTGGRVFALKPDGTQKWQYPAAGQPGLSGLYSTPVVRSDGSLVFGTSDNAMEALNPDGTLLWKAPLGDWADSSPVVASDGTLYIGCTDKNLYAFTGTSPLLMTDWPQLLRNPQRTGTQPLGAVTGTTGRLSNLSVRTFAGSGDSTLIVGFTVGGSGSRTLLIRGVGPTLASFSVSGVLGDPTIALIPAGGTTPTATEDNWGDANASAIVAADTAVGAFPLPSGSLDAAMLNGFSPAGETVEVNGKNGATGIALVEVYDDGGNSTASLTNVSARSLVNTGAGVLIAGFVVANGTRAILVRGVGPTLANFGVSGVLAHPQLRVFNLYNGQQTVVADNDGWSNVTNAGAIASTSTSVGAFALGAGSEDASMLLTLPPGNYTAQVSGANNSTGIGLVELYAIR